MAGPATITVQQKVSTVANNDTVINAEIATQNADDFIAVSITLSGSDVIILFQKVTPAV